MDMHWIKKKEGLLGGARAILPVAAGLSGREGGNMIMIEK